MNLRKLALAASVASLAVTPIAAQAVASDRAVAPIEGESEMGGESSILIILALLAVGIGIFAADSDPVSV